MAEEKITQGEEVIMACIGASADGITAMEAFFSNFPPSPRIIIAVVQHLSPDHKSILPEILQRKADMKVFEMGNDMKPEPGNVYVLPSGSDGSISGGKFRLSKYSRAQKGLHLPIDMFLRSLAAEYQNRSAAIVLSGSGSDGCLGIKDIKDAGGLVMVQDPKSARFKGMPQNAIETGMVEKIGSPEELPAFLLEFQRNCVREDQPIDDTDSDKLMERMFRLILKRTGHDFSGYKKSTIHRRIRRKMTLHRKENFADYLALLEKSPSEVESLFRDLLIGVTSFFRDMESFKAVQEKVLTTLIKNSDGETIRIWIAACSSGEEVYSLAILASEVQEELGIRASIRIFATDIDFRALEVARQGRYRQNIRADIPDDLLKKYFSKADDIYQVDKEVRNMITFAEHNILKDPPYSQLDLISCRNFLIYLDSATQQQALNTFHYALKDDGYLFLGQSEKHSARGESFKVIGKEYALFQKRQNSRSLEDYLYQARKKDVQVHRGKSRQPGEPVSVGEFAEKTALRDYMNPFLVIDKKGEIQYSLGQCEKYLSFPVGEPDRNIVNLVKEGLKLPVSSALRKIRTKAEPVRLNNIKVTPGDDVMIVNLSLIPVTRPAHLNHLVIVSIEPGHTAGTKEKEGDHARDMSEESDDYIQQLERELQENREYLGNVIEDLETANEELKTANEEAVSTNEELQSTIEELETSKEEMQSLNEELDTSNTELHRKVDEITRANNDLETLLRSTDLGILYLDRDLRIRRFSPKIKAIVNLLESDIGRSIEDFEIKFSQADLIGHVRHVLQNLEPLEKDISRDDEKYYWMRILPYRIIDRRVDGVVITFTDITERYRVQELIQESEQLKRYKYLFHHIEHGFALCKAMRRSGGNIYDLQLKESNVAFEEIVGVNLEKDRNSKMSELFSEKSIPLPVQQICRRLQTGKTFNDEIHTGETDRFLKILFFSVDSDLVAGFVQDVTGDRKEIKARLHLASIVESTEDAIFSESTGGKILTWNMGAANLYGYTEKEAAGSDAGMLYNEPDKEQDIIRRIKKGENVTNQETVHYRKDGTTVHVSVTRSPIRNERQEIVAISTIAKDITHLREREQELVKARKIAEQSVKTKNLFLSNISHEVRTPLNSILGFAGMLDDEVRNPKCRRYIGNIVQSGKQLLNIINDIVDVSRLEAGELPVHPALVNIDKLMRETREQFEGYAATDKKQLIDFRIKLPDHKDDLYTVTDGHRLRQIIHNLLSNAFKYTEKGYVEFGYRDTGRGELLFYVSDSGVGISRRYHEKIFERFQQVEETVPGQVIRGTGLGLTIARGLTRHLGGRMWVESEKGKGSVFYFTIPLKQDPDKKDAVHTEEITAPDLTGKRILIGEDDPYNLEILRFMLKDTGAKISAARDGEKVLELFHSKGADLILLDIRMPKKNGYELLKKIRSTNHGIPAIAVSAFAMPEQIKKSMDTGFDDHLVKPVSRKVLYDTLVEHLNLNG